MGFYCAKISRYFASWITCDLIKTQLIFSRINGPNVHASGMSALTTQKLKLTDKKLLKNVFIASENLVK